MATLKEIKKAIYDAPAYNTDEFYSSVEATFIYRGDGVHCLVMIVAQVSNDTGKPLGYQYTVFDLDADSFADRSVSERISNSLVALDGLDFEWNTPDISVIPQVNKDQKHLDTLTGTYIDNGGFTDEEQLDYAKTMAHVVPYRTPGVQQVYKVMSEHMPVGGGSANAPVISTSPAPAMQNANSAAADPASAATSASVLTAVSAGAGDDVWEDPFEDAEIDDFDSVLDSIQTTPNVSVDVPEHPKRSRKSGDVNSFHPSGGMTINIPNKSDFGDKGGAIPPSMPPTP